MTEYDIFHGFAFGWMIPLYFFLGGISAGAYVISVYAAFWNTSLKPLARPASIISPIALAVGLGILVLDLTQPFRFWQLMVTFHPSSMASWGTWILSIFFAISVVYAFLLGKGKEAQAKRTGYLGLPFALVTATYTGLLLAQMQGVELWHTALLPWLFLVGALISGSALVVLVSITMGIEMGPFAGLRKLVLWLIGLDILLVISELLILANGGSQSLSALRLLLAGRYAFGFLFIQIFLGALVPIYILLNEARVRNPQVQAVTATLVLIGVFAMRYILVMAGQAVLFK